MIAGKLKALAAGETYTPPAAAAAPVATGRKGSKAAAAAAAPKIEEEPRPISQFSLRLGKVVESRRKSVHELREVERYLLWTALGLLLFAPLMAALRGNVLLLPLIAGFAVIAAALAMVLRACTDSIAQSIVGIQYIRTSFEDEALPGRQRSLLQTKAGQILGEI